MKLLLHTCCAPCSVFCIDVFQKEKIKTSLFWYNPNIHLYSEYKARLDCLKKFADNEKTDLILIDEYGLRSFLNEASENIKDRCEKCYRMRLEKTAQTAANKGFAAFTTTLLISPYQNHELIKQIGKEAAAKYRVEFLYRDFRPHFREGQKKARENGMYMQKYCGCIFSEEEKYLKKISYKDMENTEKKKQHLPSAKDSSLFFQRLKMLTGSEGLEKLKNTRVVVFGVGGVGSWCAEALVRSGIGTIDIVDFDNVCESNVNRQLQATSKTIGQKKVKILKQRLLEINPGCKITAWDKVFSGENANLFNIEKADYVIDAIDTVKEKIDLIETVCSLGVTLFSSMGMALRIDPSQIKISTIWKTEGCPLARLVRTGLRKRGFKGDFTVVYSDNKKEKLNSVSFASSANSAENSSSIFTNKRVNASVVTVTASAGFFLASLVLRHRLGVM